MKIWNMAYLNFPSKDRAALPRASRQSHLDWRQDMHRSLAKTSWFKWNVSSFPLSKEIILLEVPNFHWLPWLLEVDLISFWCVNRMKEKNMRTAIANVSLYGGIPSTPNLLKGLWVSPRKTTSALKIRCSKRGVWHQEQHHTLIQYGQDMTRRVSGNPVMILRIWFQRFLTHVQDVSGSKILEPPVASKSSTQKKTSYKVSPN